MAASRPSFTDKGIDTGDVLAEKAAVTVETSYSIPDLLGNLSRLVPVSRSTIANILIDSGRLGEVKINPQQFIEQAREAIDGAHAALLTDGITYKPRGEGDDEFYEMRLFHDGADDFDKWEREELEANTIAVDKGLSPTSSTTRTWNAISRRPSTPTKTSNCS